MDPSEIASKVWSRQRSDGTVVTWQQEDEDAVTNKAEAVAMVQRTLDFWLPMIAGQLAERMDEPKALAFAKTQIIETLIEQMNQPFARKWGLSVNDFALRFE